MKFTASHSYQKRKGIHGKRNEVTVREKADLTTYAYPIKLRNTCCVALTYGSTQNSDAFKKCDVQLTYKTEIRRNFEKYLRVQPDLNQITWEINILMFFKSIFYDFLEETGGFEPPALQFCKLLPWATRARLHMNV